MKHIYYNLIIILSIFILGILINYFNWENSFYSTNSTVRVIFNIITEFGSYYVIFLVIIAIFIFSDKELGKKVLIIMIICGLLSELLKIIIKDPKPLTNYWMGENQAIGYGFPSGHTQNSVVFYMIILYLPRVPDKNHLSLVYLTKICIVCLVFLIPLSRLILGMHDINDVIGGLMIGFLFLNIIVLLNLNSDSIQVNLSRE